MNTHLYKVIMTDIREFTTTKQLLELFGMEYAVRERKTFTGFPIWEFDIVKKG